MTSQPNVPYALYYKYEKPFHVLQSSFSVSFQLTIQSLLILQEK